MTQLSVADLEHEQVVGIGERIVSRRHGEVLVTYSLGSCLGVVLYDPCARVAGLLHSLLPLSRTDPDRAKRNPYLFVDTGLVRLLEEMIEAGASRINLVAWLAGASHILDDGGFFRIGARNCEVGRLILTKNSIPTRGESVGGSAPRTLRCHAGGRVTVKVGNEEVTL